MKVISKQLVMILPVVHTAITVAILVVGNLVGGVFGSVTVLIAGGYLAWLVYDADFGLSIEAVPEDGDFEDDKDE